MGGGCAAVKSSNYMTIKTTLHSENGFNIFWSVLLKDIILEFFPNYNNNNNKPCRDQSDTVTLK